MPASTRQLTVSAFFLIATVQSQAQVNQLHISEVDPATGQVEITNNGDGFTTSSALPFCHLFNYQSSIPNGTTFDPGGRELFNITGLSATNTDLWLYSSAPFGVADNILNGLQFGGPSNGRTGLASGVGLWDGADRFAPAPSTGSTLAWDGSGDTAFDWYIDETPTLGTADSTTPGTIPSVLAFPGATQDFESMSLGDEIIAIQNWPVVNTAQPGEFAVRSVDDVAGVRTPRGDSTRWIRIHDQDASDNQNRFYGPFVDAPSTANYSWRFWINVERTPPDPAVRGGLVSNPRFTIQHRINGGGVVNTWGIEYDSNSAYLIVTDQGGNPDRIALFNLNSPTGVGDWVQVELFVDFDLGEVLASVNGGAPAVLPINPDANVDPTSHRFCYRGEGVGNIGTFLVDDVTVTVDDPDLIFVDSFESLTGP